MSGQKRRQRAPKQRQAADPGAIGKRVRTARAKLREGSQVRAEARALARQAAANKADPATRHPSLRQRRLQDQKTLAASRPGKGARR